jgi:hypothetical protein
MVFKVAIIGGGVYVTPETMTVADVLGAVLLLPRLSCELVWMVKQKDSK